MGDLTKLGWNAERDAQFAPHLAKGLIPARVAVEDKHFYRVWTADAELTAQVTGKFIHESRKDHSILPKVGDWVAVKRLLNEEKATIHAILPRRTKITRKTSGRETAAQILATNVEIVFLVTAADSTFNAARLERMLVMAHESGALPVVVLNKIDLCDDLDAKLAEAQRAAGEALVLAACALTGKGMKKVAALIKPGDTVVFIGTSGVGKSSLINKLYGEDLKLLADHFFKVFAHDKNPRLTGFSNRALLAIQAYDWPGNVRELINRIRRALVMSEGRLITPEDLDLPHTPWTAQWRSA